MITTILAVVVGVVTTIGLGWISGLSEKLWYKVFKPRQPTWLEEQIREEDEAQAQLSIWTPPPPPPPRSLYELWSKTMDERTRGRRKSHNDGTKTIVIRPRKD